MAPPLERESVAGGDRGVEPTVFVWIVASYIVVYIVDYVSTWCNCNHRRERVRVRLVRSEDDRDRYDEMYSGSKGATRSSLTINTIQGRTSSSEGPDRFRRGEKCTWVPVHRNRHIDKPAPHKDKPTGSYSTQRLTVAQSSRALTKQKTRAAIWAMKRSLWAPRS